MHCLHTLHQLFHYLYLNDAWERCIALLLCIKLITWNDYNTICSTSYDELTTLVSENKKTGKTVYWTATWCGPCKQISPEFEKLAKEYEEMDFAKVDIDEVSDAAKSAGITSVPTFQFFKHGHFLGQFSGADVDKLKSYVRQVDDLDEETLQNTVAARQAQEANEKSIIACISVCVRTFCLRVCLRPRHVLFPQSISTWSYCAWHSV
eukprot:m.97728 g.97728  ORF g.97728 m.97728 type:complete len:207 (-) comp16727_c0_seq1:87-707(-)